MTQTEHVEGDITLRCELAPVSYGKRFWEAPPCQQGNNLSREDGPFGRVRAMDVR
jgi:hypothetical protein